MVRRPFAKKKPAKSRLSADRQRPSASNLSRSSFSYYASRRTAPSTSDPSRRTVDPTQPTTSTKDILRQWSRRFGAVVLAGLLVVCVVNLLQIDNKPRIVILNHSAGYALHPISTYQSAVTATLRSSLLNSNKITVDTKSVVSTLQTQFPEVQDASMVLPLVGHRPTVYIELTQPILILNTANQSVVVDNSGHAIVTAQSVNDLSSFQLPSIIDQSQLNLKVGDTVLSSTSVTFIQTVLYQLAAQHIGVGKLVLPAGTEELDVYLAHQAYYAKFNLHETDARQEVGTLIAVLRQLNKQGITPAKYIDVRLAGRAYYK